MEGIRQCGEVFSAARVSCGAIGVATQQIGNNSVVLESRDGRNIYAKFKRFTRAVVKNWRKKKFNTRLLKYHTRKLLKKNKFKRRNLGSGHDLMT